MEENKSYEPFLPADPNRCAVCAFWSRSFLNGNSKNGTCSRINFVYTKDGKHDRVAIQTPRWGLCDKFGRKAVATPNPIQSNAV